MKEKNNLGNDRFGEDSKWLWDNYDELMKKYAGKFVIIVNKTVVKVFDDVKKAMKFGLSTYGNENFVCGIMNGENRGILKVSSIF